jgi:AraC-like DNA-binding protein
MGNNNEMDSRFLLRYIDSSEHDTVLYLSIYDVPFEIYLENIFFTDEPVKRFAVNHSHAFHEICLFAKGEGVMHIDEEALLLKEYSVSYTPRFCSHYLSTDSRSYVRPYHILFLFDEAEMEKKIGRPLDLKPVVIHDAKLLFSYVEKIQWEFKNNEFNSRDSIRCLFVLLLTEIFRILLPGFEPKEKPEEKNHIEESELKLIYSIGAFFEYNYAKDIRMEDVAEKFNISPRHFDRIMKKYFNMSYKKKLSLTRIQVAMYLLKNTDEAVSRIAEKVGYNSLNTFQRAFRELTRVTPSVYRKQSKNGHKLK